MISMKVRLERAQQYEMAVYRYINALHRLLHAQLGAGDQQGAMRTLRRTEHDTLQMLTHLHDVMRTGKWPSYWMEAEVTPERLDEATGKLEEWRSHVADTDPRFRPAGKRDE